MQDWQKKLLNRTPPNNLDKDEWENIVLNELSGPGETGFGSEDFKHLMKKGYGYENPQQVPEIRKAAEETYIKRHGGLGSGSATVFKKGLKTISQNRGVNEEITSPFCIPSIHKKSMETRLKNNTNPFVTNNPMKNKERALSIAQKRSGANHYKRKTIEWYLDRGNGWELLDVSDQSLSEALESYGVSKNTYYYMLKGNRSPTRGSAAGFRAKKVIKK